MGEVPFSAIAASSNKRINSDGFSSSMRESLAKAQRRLCADRYLQKRRTMEMDLTELNTRGWMFIDGIPYAHNM